MTTVTAQTNHRGIASGAPVRMGLIAYITLLREAFAEALQRTHEARRKYPFADV